MNCEYCGGRIPTENGDIYYRVMKFQVVETLEGSDRRTLESSPVCTDCAIPYDLK